MKLNLGCGPHVMQGWVNIDIDHGDRRWDLRKGLPPQIIDGTVEAIYTEHFIEHISKAEAIRLLRDCYKSLRKGGVIRISTPDLEAWASDYLNWYHGNSTPNLPQAWQPKTPCDMLNQGMREWGHQYLWDHNELANALREAGFKNSILQKHSVSCDLPAVLSNKEVRPSHNDLIMEAVKD